MALFVGESESYDTDAWDAYILKKENKKLRELCADMASHLREAERIYGDELLPEGYITRMRELGIRVG